MDTDCLICFESHATYDCPERKPECCPDCHVFIKHFSDHTPACGLKQWLHQPYKNLYAKIPIKQIIVGFNAPMRFLYDGFWRKPFDGEEMFSTESDVFIRFQNENDFAVFSGSFAPIRIAVVIKDESDFSLKLMLLRSNEKFIVLKGFNQPFDRAAAKAKHQWKTTLIVVVTSAENLRLSLLVQQSNSHSRMHEIRYNIVTKMFEIPQELVSSASMPKAKTLQSNTQIAVNPNNQLALNNVSRWNFEMRAVTDGPVDCRYCYDENHGKNCRRYWEKCFECHVPAQEKTDHAENCGVKNWFQSEKYVDMYAKIPAVRAEITFEKSVSFFLNGKFTEAVPGIDLFSAMADVQLKFVSRTTLALKTTAFTRIRLPVVVKEQKGSSDTYTERIVFMTSGDRTLVAANSSRVVHQSSIAAEFEHNTPMVLLVQPFTKMTVDVHSGGRVHSYVVDYGFDGSRFRVPEELNVKSLTFTPKLFDAEIPVKKFSR